MQPFDAVTQPSYPSAPQQGYPSAPQQGYPSAPQQGQPGYPSAPQQGQPQGQYPQSQQAGYPTLPNRPSNPQNYQPPFPSQQPGGYPSYQAQPQPQYVVYAQGGNQGSDGVQKALMAQQLSRNIKSGGGGLVACYSLIAAIVAFGVASNIRNQTSYQVMSGIFEKMANRPFNPAYAFSDDSCTAFLADIIAIPMFLWGFAAFNFFAMCVSFTGLTCCMFFQALAALFWAGFAVFANQQNCSGYSLLTSLLKAQNIAIPQNACPYYAGLAAASLVACCLNYNWSSNKDKAQRDQRNLALMMAAS